MHTVKAEHKMTARHQLKFVWLEITGKCQLQCTHCYAESGPTGGHGTMTVDDWHGVIDQAADLGANMVQFIGGEPTLHRDLPDLIEYAVAEGVEVEVFSNLVAVSDPLWKSFSRDGVRLACSYYSDDADQHQAITDQHQAITGRNSHARTKANIAEAVSRSIPLRVGVVDLGDDQHVEAAHAELAELGVTDIGHDHLRGIGRGVRGGEEGKAQLCGNCINGSLAVSPTGEVWPCVFSRWLPVGNVMNDSLAEVLDGSTYAKVRNDLEATFAAREPQPAQVPCVPNMCNPQCGPSCSPACRPANNCGPVGACAPSYR